MSWRFIAEALLPKPDVPAQAQSFRIRFRSTITWLPPYRLTDRGWLSIGAGPAAYLASQRPIAGLILVTPFDSLTALAREHYPWAPVSLLLRYRMEIAEQRHHRPLWR